MLTRLLVFCCALTLAASAGPADAGDGGADAGASGRRAPASVQVVGSGYGHGHGLSQWGAQLAAQKGLSHRRILRFYYPGLAWGTSAGNVSVLVTGDTTNDVVVVDRAGLRAQSRGRSVRLDKQGKARLWRITAAGGGRRSAIAWKGAGRGWKTLRTLPGQAEFTAGGRPITLVTPSERRAYRGVLRSAAPSSAPARRDTVNVLPLDSYLKGVVPREVYTSWKPAALRAQSVAARTYAAFERAAAPKGRHYQICDTTSCQVYGGATDEVASTNQAIDATSRQVLTKAGKPAFTQFSASNGGFTAAGSFGYLPAKKDPYDTAYRNWKDTVTAAEIQRALPAIGTFRTVKVLRRDGNGRYGGRVVTIRITGSKASTTISGDSFRSWFGLRSTMFRVG